VSEFAEAASAPVVPIELDSDPAERPEPVAAEILDEAKDAAVAWTESEPEPKPEPEPELPPQLIATSAETPPPKQPYWQPSPNVVLKTDPERPWLHIIAPAVSPLADIEHQPQAEEPVPTAESEVTSPTEAVREPEIANTTQPVEISTTAPGYSTPPPTDDAETSAFEEEDDAPVLNDESQENAVDEEQAREPRRPANRRRRSRSRSAKPGELPSADSDASSEASPASGQTDASPNVLEDPEKIREDSE
jgi:hypothetical protein